MKCIVCGNENVQNARFCAFCGEKLTDSAAAAQQPEKETPVVPAPRQTARPLSDNPYMPPRSPAIPSGKPAKHAAAEEAAPASEQPSEPLPQKTVQLPRQIIKPAEKRVFLFDEEIEEEEEKRQASEQRAAQKRRYEEEEEYDEFTEYEDDEEDDELYDEEDEPRGGRIFIRIFSALTVILLIVGIVSFMYGTTVGRRLRASVGLSSQAEDYILLADWQLSQYSMKDASASYYNAFKLDQDNFDLALTVGTGFENTGDNERAEQLYTFMIESYPQADAPYDRLMALLIRQGKTSQYENLLIYRSEHQPGYTPPAVEVPDAPTASHRGGAYAGTVSLTLDASGNEIRYTINGTVPTENSLLYTGPITLTKGSHNLRAVAVKNGQLSAEWTGSFVISR